MSVFLDTSVLLAGLIDVGPQSAPAQSLLHAVAEKRVPSPATAWHCCLEFYSVATRLPPEYRLTPADCVRLLDEEVFARLSVYDLPAADRLTALRAAARDGIAGGRVYDAHIAEVRGRHRRPSSSPTTGATSCLPSDTTCASRRPPSSSSG